MDKASTARRLIGAQAKIITNPEDSAEWAVIILDTQGELVGHSNPVRDQEDLAIELEKAKRMIQLANFLAECENALKD